MNNITALKAVYNRKTKGYDVVSIRNADVRCAQNGFLVFQDASYALAGICNGSLIGSWATAKKDALVKWLETEIAK